MELPVKVVIGGTRQNGYIIDFGNNNFGYYAKGKTKALIPDQFAFLTVCAKKFWVFETQVLDQIEFKNIKFKCYEVEAGLFTEAESAKSASHWKLRYIIRESQFWNTAPNAFNELNSDNSEIDKKGSRLILAGVTYPEIQTLIRDHFGRDYDLEFARRTGTSIMETREEEEEE